MNQMENMITLIVPEGESVSPEEEKAGRVGVEIDTGTAVEIALIMYLLRQLLLLLLLRFLQMITSHNDVQSGPIGAGTETTRMWRNNNKKKKRAMATTRVRIWSAFQICFRSMYSSVEEEECKYSSH